MRSEQESGITITSVDRVAGIILGSKDGIDVTITVRPQAVR